MKKIKIEIKNRFTGKALFSYESENNTTKETLLEAIKAETNLDGANLYGANLYGADLDGADLDGANLVGANLYGANLDGANLDGVPLPMYCKWPVMIVDDTKVKIGCKVKTIEEWDAWFSGSETFSTARDSEEFKKITAMYQAARSYINIMTT